MLIKYLQIDLTLIVNLTSIYFWQG